MKMAIWGYPVIAVYTLLLALAARGWILSRKDNMIIRSLIGASIAGLSALLGYKLFGINIFAAAGVSIASLVAAFKIRIPDRTRKVMPP